MSCNLIIPARSGSKGILKKNISLVGGLPLIAHIINAAKLASSIKDIFVSTDGEEIAKIASDYGAKIIIRPKEISGDSSSSEEAILHALNFLEKKNSQTEYTCFGQCTSPFTSSQDFDEAIKLIQEKNYDSLFAATIFHHFLWTKDQNGQMHGVNHNQLERRLMRQEKTPEYLESGAFYIFKTKGFIEAKQRFFGKIGMYEMAANRVFEIDTIEDLNQARILFEKQNETIT